jgi:hypothetical protein
MDFSGRAKISYNLTDFTETFRKRWTSAGGLAYFLGKKPEIMDFAGRAFRILVGFRRIWVAAMDFSGRAEFTAVRLEFCKNFKTSAAFQPAATHKTHPESENRARRRLRGDPAAA